ncbi:C45 family autoproteolytic acyltransferase/hydolase [Natronospora cellulosivora (SeqCode)]
MKKKLFLIVIIILATSFNIYGINQVNTYEVVVIDNKMVFEGGELTDAEGIPYLKLSGSYYEMGLQYGVLLKEELNELNAEARAFLKSAMPWYLKPFSNLYFNREAKKMEERIPKDYRDEIKGIAEGSGLSYNDLLLFSSFPEIFLGCTSVLTRIDGEVVLARNFDFLPFLGRYPVVVEYNLDGKVKVTCIGIIGYSGVLTGLNDSGLSLSLNTISMAKRETSEDLMIGFKNREILESANVISDVGKLLNNYKSEVGWAITIASSKENNGAIYELATTGIKKHELNEEDYLVVNNSFIDDDLRHNNMGVLTARNFRNQGRNDVVNHQLENNPVDNIDDLLNLLASVKFYEYEDLVLGLGHYTVNNEGSIQSILIDYNNKQFLLAVGVGYSGLSSFYRYEINQGFLDTYKEGSSTEEIQRLLKRRDKIMNLFWANDYQGIEEMIYDFEDPNIYEISGLVDIEISKDNEKLLEMIDHEINKYDKLPELYIRKGKILIEEGRYEDAILVLEKALTLPYLFEADEVHIYRYLARAYNDSEDKFIASSYAQRCIDLIEKYHIGVREQEIIDEVINYKK